MTQSWRSWRAVLARSEILPALMISAGALVTLLATDRDYAMVWDEGLTVRRERVLADWFARLGRGGAAGRAEAFSAAKLTLGWPFSREEPDGHPPFYALLGLAGWRLSRAWLGPLTAYRFGPMVLAAATVGAVYLHLARRRGRLAGWTAAGTLLLIPQCFSLAHYAHYDMPVACLWLLAQMAFLNALRSRWWIVPFGVALGLAAGTKFTGLFALVPPLTWVAWSEWIGRIPLYPRPGGRPTVRPSRRGTWVLGLGVLVAIGTLYAIQPAWWLEPIEGPRRFFASNLTRSSTIAIPSLYLGRFYRYDLPWHNTIVLTAVSLPAGILALGLAGIGSVLARRPRDDGEGWLWVLSWGTLMVVRALPGAPGHDGIRLILPSIASLALLAGIGAAALRDRLAGTRLARLPSILSALALSGAALGIASIYPYTLSYYSEAIGGLKGADRLGFQRTYYWDTLGPEFFTWVRDERRRHPLDLRFPSALIHVYYLREWGVLPPDVRVFGMDPESRDEVYVAQCRRTSYLPHDWWLERHGHPLFTIRRQGVDLLHVYSGEEGRRAVVETLHEPVPDYLAN